MAVETTPPAAPASRNLTDGFYAKQGIDTDGFTTPGESIQNTLSGTDAASPAETGNKSGRVTAADRAARRNKVGKPDKTMFNQLNSFDRQAQPSSAAQGTVTAANELATGNTGNFAGQKYKP